jgi:cytochrome c553|tara:strand:- start:2198 stop:2545 length:348 start_codon:yes stop_codon:yes gene_type:complete
MGTMRHLIPFWGLFALVCILLISGCSESPGKPKSVAGPGQEKAVVCMSCHGATGNDHSPGTPKLAGQDYEYLVDSMKAYADGRRTHELMKTFVAGLTDEDLADLAGFYSANKGLR